MMNFEFIVQLLQASYTPLIIALNVYFISRFRRLSVVHINFRILFSSLVVQLTLSPICASLVHGIQFLSQNTSDDRLIPNLFSILFSLLHAFSIIFALFLLLFLVLERLIATIMRGTYERWNGSMSIGFLILQGIITLTLVVYYFIYDIQTASKIDLRADRGPFLFHERQPNFVQFVWSVSGSAFCIEIMTLLLLYKHNKIMLSQRLNQRLSVRYQFKENVALVGTLLVGITLFGLLLALEIAAQFLLVGEEQFTNKNFVAGQIQLMLFDLFDMLFVLYIIIWYPQLCNMVKADLRCQSGMRLTDVAATVYVKPSPELEGQTHFQQLNSSWNGNLSSGRNSQH